MEREHCPANQESGQTPGLIRHRWKCVQTHYIKWSPCLAGSTLRNESDLGRMAAQRMSFIIKFLKDLT